MVNNLSCIIPVIEEALFEEGKTIGKSILVKINDGRMNATGRIVLDSNYTIDLENLVEAIPFIKQWAKFGSPSVIAIWNGGICAASCYTALDSAFSWRQASNTLAKQLYCVSFILVTTAGSTSGISIIARKCEINAPALVLEICRSTLNKAAKRVQNLADLINGAPKANLKAARFQRLQKFYRQSSKDRKIAFTSPFSGGYNITSSEIIGVVVIMASLYGYIKINISLARYSIQLISKFKNKLKQKKQKKRKFQFNLLSYKQLLCNKLQQQKMNKILSFVFRTQTCLFTHTFFLKYLFNIESLFKSIIKALLEGI